MSRSTLSKSRTEKGGKAPSTTPAVAHEIIPGKFTDQDWFFMLDRDEGDDFAHEIVEEVCSSVMDVIFKSYIEKQLIPYTVCQAKDAMLQIIEWQFLARDEGEEYIEFSLEWSQDEEPAPAITDCWAQGSVPKRHRTPRPVSIMEADEEPTALADIPEAPSHLEENQMEVEVQDDEMVEEEQSLPPEDDEEVMTPSRPASKSLEKEISQVSSKKRSSYKPHKGPLRSARTAEMAESLNNLEMKMLKQQHQELIQSQSQSKTPDLHMLQMPASCHSIVKLQAGRPPGNREVQYDELGNVISVFKLEPEKLPNHRVRTGFRVIDPAIEAAQARLEAMRTGKHIKSDRVPKPPTSSKPIGTRNSTMKTGSKTIVLNNSKYIGKDPKTMDVAPLPPPMIDTMELMPGVVVTEGERTKRGPKLYNRKMEAMLSALHKNLKPMTQHRDDPTMTVSEILAHQTPVVKPLVDNTPVPPISSQKQYC